MPFISHFLINFIFIIACSLATISCVSNQHYAQAPTDIIINNTNQKNVVSQIISHAMNSGMTLINANDYLVVIETRNTSFGAALLYGSRYDSKPALRIEYSIAEIETNRVRVAARAKMVTNPGSAFERANDVTDQLSAQIFTELTKINNTINPSSKGVAASGLYGRSKY